MVSAKELTELSMDEFTIWREKSMYASGRFETMGMAVIPKPKIFAELDAENHANSTKTRISVLFPESNQARETISTKLWGDGTSYEELRELWAKTGDPDYLERMLEKVELNE